ncbi:MAG: hypothetical protein WDO56_23880 [Gammaproteobacteria bacterium]
MTREREAARRKLVALITFVYLLLIFEGALRKWVFPSAAQALFFIRDPFVLLAYWLALRNGFFPKDSPFLKIGLGLAFCAFLLVAAQLLGAGGSVDGALMLAGYGFRNYFFYLPFAFVIGEVFERRDFERVVKITLFLAVPISVIMFLQFISPLDSPINVGFAAAKTSQFRGLTVDEVHTRPMGLFTSDLGQREFTASALAMALSLWLVSSARRFIKFWLLLPATGAVLACLAIGGSRGAMVQSGIVAVAAVGSALVVRSGSVSIRAVIWPSVIGVAAVILYPILLPDQYAAFTTRWNAAAAVETQHFEYGIFGRALYSFVDFYYLIGQTPLLGYGIGLAGNARLTLGIVIPGFTGWAESDWARHIVDLGPIMGIVFIAFRVALVIWLGWRCLGAARRTRDPTVLLLFAYVGVELLYGQISGHGSVNGYAWIFTGFCLAACRWRSSDAEEKVSEPTLAQPRFANLMR